MHATCIHDFGYLHSPDFVTFSLHTTTVISAPIHLLGFYMILKRTPAQMKSVKWYMLVLHCWIVMFDVSLSLLTVPYLLLPALAGFPLGLLQKMNVDVAAQVVVVIAFFIFVAIGILSIFENRFHIICTFGSAEFWTRWRKYWLAVHYLVVMVFLPPIAYLVPEQEAAKMNVFRSLPCLPDYIYNGPVFVLATDYTYHFIAALSFGLALSSEVVLFIVLLIRNGLHQVKTCRISRETFQIHKRFCAALVIQMQIPAMLLAYPLFYLLYCLYTDYYNQAVVNFLLLTASSHGVVSTIVMIFIHKPYRQVVLSILCKERSSNEYHNSRVVSITHNNNNNVHS